jgi:hypothetical protein
MKRALVVFVLCGCGSPSAPGVQPQPQEPGRVNVKLAPYSAAGDGLKDDTAALQKALDDTFMAGGGTVFVPTGNYKVTSHLRIRAATQLVGESIGPPKRGLDSLPAPNPSPTQIVGTTLLAYEGKGGSTTTPFLLVDGPGVGIAGLTIYYPEQTTTNPPIEYPYSIGLAPATNDVQHTENLTIHDILLLNSYDGIDIGSAPSARHRLQNIFGNPLHIGIWIGRCYDEGFVDEVHFNWTWTTNKDVWAYTQANGTAFVVNRCDGDHLSHIFTHGYHVGMRMAAIDRTSKDPDVGSGPYLFVDNMNIEGSDVGVDVYDGNTSTFTNFSYDGGGADLSTSVGIWSHAGGYPDFNLSGVSYWGPFARAIKWESVGALSVSNMQVQVINNTVPEIEVDNTWGLMLQGIVFYPPVCVPGPCPPGTPQGILVHDTVTRAFVGDNVLNGLSLVPSASAGPITIGSNAP